MTADEERELARLKREVRELRDENRVLRLERDNERLRRERLGEMYVRDLMYALRTGTVGP